MFQWREQMDETAHVQNDVNLHNLRMLEGTLSLVVV